MERKAIEVGTRYLDMKNPGTIAHVIEGGMASGRTLYVSSNGLGKAITSFVMRRFNPETLYNGAARWIPLP